MSTKFSQSIRNLQTLAATKGIQFGLDRFNQALAYFKHPQKMLHSVIHVAGTNGKGSTIAFLESGLLSKGFSVATFTSPHLQSYCERIAFNSHPISEHDFAHFFSLVKPVLMTVPLTEFELLTLLFILYCQRLNPDYILLETGLGGRLDATNCFESVLASVITAIHYDHQGYLGDTLEAIAFEKAGIIKHKCPVFTFKQSDEVMNVISTQCDLKKAPLAICTPWISSTHDWHLSGAHQSINASVAGSVLSTLLGEPRETFSSAFKRTKLAARFELIAFKETVFILDTAHNEQGINALCQNLTLKFKGRPLTAVVTCQKNRPLSIFSSLFNAVNLIYWCNMESDIFHTSEDCQIAFPDQVILPIPFCDILSHLPLNTPIVFTGSMFFIGPFREMLGGRV